MFHRQLIRRALPVLAVAMLAGVLGACSEAGSSSSTPENSRQADPVSQPPTTQPAEQAAAGELIPYPLDVCIVSGESLDSMGEAMTIAYEGREIGFCCESCVGMFKKNPAKYLAKLEPAAKPASANDDHAY